MDDDWKDAWTKMVDAIGTDFEVRGVRPGADAVSPAGIRAFLEPLEFDCPLHYDAEVARAHGNPDVIAPYTSAVTFALGPLWAPGDAPIFTSPERDFQPRVPAIEPVQTHLAPPTSGYFATEMSIDFARPPRVGERLERVGYRLVGCVPKETTVGRGAFCTWEWDIRNELDELVARSRVVIYSYVPHPETGQA